LLFLLLYQRSIVVSPFNEKQLMEELISEISFYLKKTPENAA